MLEGRRDESVPENTVYYRPGLAEVLRVDKKSWEVLIELEMAGGPLEYQPGQFVQVSVFGYGEIPISICSSPTRNKSFEICVRPVGNVSRALYELSVGDRIGVRGPYGHGFPVSEMKDRDVLVIAGGIGLAPLRSLIHYVQDNRAEYRRLAVIYGARTPAYILFEKDVKRWSEDPGIEYLVTVNEADGRWRGRTGQVTEPLRELKVDRDQTIAAVVGPPVMYRFVAMELFNKGMSAEQIYFSLERHFKCGIGKCGHCQLNDLYVCQHGPVFPLSDLLGRTEAIEAWAPEKDQD